VAAELPSGVDEKQGTLKLGMGKECATPLAEEEIVREGSLAVVCGLCAGRDAGTGRGRTWEYLEKGARENRARCGHGMCYPGPSTQNRVGRQLYVKWRRTLGVILLSECPGVRPNTDWLRGGVLEWLPLRGDLRKR
jgi:hypothetical protein